jgi:hypothetical protein
MSNPAFRKPHKYRAVRTTTEHGTFPSKGEAARYSQLFLLQRAGVISDLKREVVFTLNVNGVHIADYRADYCYNENGEAIVEDFKGKITREFRIKYALMAACHNILIRLSGTKKALKIKRAAK